MIRMRSSETVKNLRSYISGELGHSHFRILTLTERGWRPIEDESKSLTEIGLGPRAALQLAPISPKYEDLSQHIGPGAKIPVDFNELFFVQTINIFLLFFSAKK